jgi:predicted kinase
MLMEMLGSTIVINSDVVRRELFPLSRAYDPKETQAMIRETERRVREALRTGQKVILDALFTKEGSRQGYRRMAATFGVPFVLVYVTAPMEETRERMAGRVTTGDASEATFDFYLDRRPHFEPPNGPHMRIVNDGDLRALEAQVRDAAERISFKAGQ